MQDRTGGWSKIYPMVPSKSQEEEANESCTDESSCSALSAEDNLGQVNGNIGGYPPTLKGKDSPAFPWEGKQDKHGDPRHQRGSGCNHEEGCSQQDAGDWQDWGVESQPAGARFYVV